MSLARYRLRPEKRAQVEEYLSLRNEAVTNSGTAPLTSVSLGSVMDTTLTLLEAEKEIRTPAEQCEKSLCAQSSAGSPIVSGISPRIHSSLLKKNREAAAKVCYLSEKSTLRDHFGQIHTLLKPDSSPKDPASFAQQLKRFQSEPQFVEESMIASPILTSVQLLLGLSSEALNDVDVPTDDPYQGWGLFGSEDVVSQAVEVHKSVSTELVGQVSDEILDDVETHLGDPCFFMGNEEDRNEEDALPEPALTSEMKSAIGSGLVWYFEWSKAMLHHQRIRQSVLKATSVNPGLPPNVSEASMGQDNPLEEDEDPSQRFTFVVQLMANRNSVEGSGRKASAFPPIPTRKGGQSTEVLGKAVAPAGEAALVEVHAKDLIRGGETADQRSRRLQAEANALAEQLSLASGSKFASGLKGNGAANATDKPPPGVKISEIMDDLMICGILGRCEANTAMTIEKELKKAHWSSLVDVHTSLMDNHNPGPLDTMICAVAPGHYGELETFDYGIFDDDGANDGAAAGFDPLSGLEEQSVV